MGLQRFQVHAEWKERVKGKWFLVPREETIVLDGKDFMQVMKIAQRKYPNSKLMLKCLGDR